MDPGARWSNPPGRIVNMVEEGVDLALRVTRVPDESLIARPISVVEFFLVGAPAYLRASGRPQRSADLLNHAMLLYSLMPSTTELSLVGPHGPEPVKLNSVLQSSNETLLHLAALQGMGLAFLPKWMVAQTWRSGASSGCCRITGCSKRNSSVSTRAANICLRRYEPSSTSLPPTSASSETRPDGRGPCRFWRRLGARKS